MKKLTKFKLLIYCTIILLVLLSIFWCNSSFSNTEINTNKLALEARDSGRLFAFTFSDEGFNYYLIGYGEWVEEVFVIRDIDRRIWHIPKTTKVVKKYIE